MLENSCVLTKKKHLMAENATILQRVHLSQIAFDIEVEQS